MGAAKRRTPDAMPSEELSAEFLGGLGVKKKLVAGSRGDRAAAEPDFAVHGTYRLRGGKLSDVAGQHVIIFTHGYNVARREALDSAADFFGKLHAALAAAGQALDDYAFALFTWPGDVGPVWFNDAQSFAHHSGTALYRFISDLAAQPNTRVSLVTHSLGAHVGLRGASILGERRYNAHAAATLQNVLLLAPAVEDDVFERPNMLEEYHFPESAFAIRRLHIFCSRADQVLKTAFKLNEFDSALGFAGPESMSPLQSLSRRVKEVLGDEAEFGFQLHDLSPRSATIMNPRLWVSGHGNYWDAQEQVDYYANFLVA